MLPMAPPPVETYKTLKEWALCISSVGVYLIIGEYREIKANLGLNAEVGEVNEG